mgnify:CR=1 FL=1
MSWVCGTAAASALNPQTDFRRPDAVSYTFLNQLQQAAYFRAFSGDSLGRKEFADIAEHYEDYEHVFCDKLPKMQAGRLKVGMMRRCLSVPVPIPSPNMKTAILRAIGRKKNTICFISPKICAGAAAIGKFSVSLLPALHPPMR